MGGLKTILPLRVLPVRRSVKRRNLGRGHAAAQYMVRSLLGQHDGGRVEVARGDRRHDGRIHHSQALEPIDAGIRIDKSAGFMSFHRTKSVRFTPEKPGEYPFYCGVDSHMKKGMTGTLVVR